MILLEFLVNGILKKSAIYSDQLRKITKTYLVLLLTRMTTCIKAKLKKSDEN